jgi:hypothetical protein
MLRDFFMLAWMQNELLKGKNHLLCSFNFLLFLPLLSLALILQCLASFLPTTQ